MSLDVHLYEEVYSGNITHNLADMAVAAGIDKHLWEPEKLSIYDAGELIEPLRKGLEKLEANPEYFKQFEPANKWGTYEDLIIFVREYLRYCILFPNSRIEISR